MSSGNWQLQLPDGTRVGVSRHALDRWQEYVCPGRTRTYAMQFLEHMVNTAGELGPPPAWLMVNDDAPELFVTVGDFVLTMPVDENGRAGVVTTIVARGCLLPAVREHRHRTRRGRRRYRWSHSATRQQEARRGDRRRRRDRQAPSIDDQ
jgi:hypothetical protein